MSDPFEDKPIPEDAEISAAHPLTNRRADTYDDAMRMVSAKQSKGALVELVNWLLQRIKYPAGEDITRARKKGAEVATSSIVHELRRRQIFEGRITQDMVADYIERQAAIGTWGH